MAKTAKAQKNHGFPDYVYVSHAGEGEGHYFETDDKIDSKEDGDFVAVYRLDVVRRMLVSKTLK